MIGDEEGRRHHSAVQTLSEEQSNVAAAEHL